jgi:hypothetical protein
MHFVNPHTGDVVSRCDVNEDDYEINGYYLKPKSNVYDCAYIFGQYYPIKYFIDGVLVIEKYFNDHDEVNWFNKNVVNKPQCVHNPDTGTYEPIYQYAINGILGCDHDTTNYQPRNSSFYLENGRLIPQCMVNYELHNGLYYSNKLLKRKKITPNGVMYRCYNTLPYDIITNICKFLNPVDMYLFDGVLKGTYVFYSESLRKFIEQPKQQKEKKHYSYYRTENKNIQNIIYLSRYDKISLFLKFYSGKNTYNYPHKVDEEYITTRLSKPSIKIGELIDVLNTNFPIDKLKIEKLYVKHLSLIYTACNNTNKNPCNYLYNLPDIMKMSRCYPTPNLFLEDACEELLKYNDRKNYERLSKYIGDNINNINTDIVKKYVNLELANEYEKIKPVSIVKFLGFLMLNGVHIRFP